MSGGEFMVGDQAMPMSAPARRTLRLVTPPVTPRVDGVPSPTSSGSSASRRLERELEAAREEASGLRELLEELPAILERKFQLRLGTLLMERRQLEQENALLLMALRTGDLPQPLAAAPPAEFLAESSLDTPSPTHDSPITMGLGLRRALRLLYR